MTERSCRRMRKLADIDAWVQRQVESAPELSDQQVARLRALLFGVELTDPAR